MMWTDTRDLLTNTRILLTTVISLPLCAAAYSYGAVDYQKVRKDINVMTQILESAFVEERDCRRCSANVEGSYLAEQGAVFIVEGSAPRVRYVTGGNHGWDFDGLEDLAHLPEMIGDVLAEIEIDFGNEPRIVVGDVARHRSEASRLRRELRRLDRDIHRTEDEIQDLEFDKLDRDESEHDRLDEEKATIGDRLRKLEARREELMQRLTAEREEVAERRASALAEITERHEQQVTESEDLIVETLCDYGGMLKNLPDGERVSVLLKSSRINPPNRSGRASSWAFARDDLTNVLVFKKTDLLGCQNKELSAIELRQRAIVYEY